MHLKRRRLPLPWLIAPLLCLAIAMQMLIPARSEEVSRQAVDLFKIGPIPITNSMVTAWLVSIALIVAIRIAIGRRPSPVPTRAQAALEIIAENLRSLFEPIVGSRAIGNVFPFLLILFTFLLAENLCGLIPGVGSIAVGNGHGHFVPILRPPNGDLNGTLALAIISFSAWIFFVLRHAGPKEFFHDTFGNKGDRREVPLPIYAFLGAVFLAVGAIDVISILFRIVSLSFRLYGNVFGGENLIGRMSGLCGAILPVPFYFLELLIGVIQAFVFTLLTAVYIGLLTAGGSEERHG
ncbi:MAG: F0F1 ATP synthase subunit A [Puniceicoccales bacterium]|jgi:F-type H+-transporting ATPase subunit a|nr:F0F1 ATP synthase subunit A [Puniceicoccales bacterium]